MTGIAGLTPLVTLNGMSLHADWQNALLEVRVELQFQLPARVTLRFSDPGYKLVSSGISKMGTPVEVKSPDGQTKIVSAEVTSVTCDQRIGQQPELVLVALDKSHRLGRTTTIKVFQEVTYSDIVSQVAMGAGLTAQTDATDYQFEYMLQADSDLSLITEAAHRTGFDWWVEDETLHFKKPKKGNEVELSLGAGLRSFTARASGMRPEKVVVNGWDDTNQALFTSEIEKEVAPLASSDFADHAKSIPSFWGSSQVMTGNLAITSNAEAKSVGQAVYDRGVTAMVTAKGVADGNASIALGKSAKISGAGPLNGDYPVTEVEHIYRPATGFVTRFTSGERRPTTLVDSLATSGTSAGAYAGPTYTRTALTIGKVASNKDPDKKGRVKVRFPGFGGTPPASQWARIATMGGGDQRGSVWIPEVNDEVLVGFEGGDARRPVILGGLYNAKQVMPETEIDEASGAVQTRAMTSRLGHAVALLDGTSAAKQAIELVLDGKQHLVHLGKDKLAMTVPKGIPVEVTAGDTSVKFSKDGDVTVEGANVTVKATQALKLQGNQVSIEAQSTLDMKGNTKAGLSAADVEVQGKTAVKISGLEVLIN